MSFLGSIGGALKAAAPIALGALIPGAGGAIAGALASGVLNHGSTQPPGSTGGFSGPYGLNAMSGGASPAIPDSALGIDQGGGGVSGLLSQAGDWITGNGGKNALGAIQGINAVLQQKKASDLANKALHSAEGAYNERAPLRAMGLSGLAGSQVGNPYATNGGR